MSCLRAPLRLTGLVALLAIIVSAGLAGPAEVLFRWDIPLGRDGFYYVLQVQSIRTTGYPWYPTQFSGGLYVIALLGAACDDVVVGNKVAALATFAALVAAVHFLLHVITVSHRWALLGASFLALSPLKYYFTVEYLANLIGITSYALATSFWLASRREAGRIRRRLYLLLAVVAGCLTVWFHKSAAAMVAITLLGALAYRALELRVRLSGGRVIAAAFVGVLVVSSAFLTTTYFLIPATTQWLRANTRPIPIPDIWGFSFAPESMFLSASAMLLAVRYARHRPQLSPEGARMLPVFLGIAALICANPFLRYRSGLDNAAERMGLWALLCVPLMAAVIASIPEDTRHNRRFRPAAALPLAAVVLCLVPRIPVGATEGYLRSRMLLAAQLRQLQEWNAADLPVIAEHGTQFMVTALTGHRSSSPVTGGRNHREEFWLIRDSHEALCRSETEMVFCGNGWALLRDEALSQWTRTAPAASLASLIRQNPQHARWMLRLQDVN